MPPFPVAEFLLAPTSFGAVESPKKKGQEGKETGQGLVLALGASPQPRSALPGRMRECF